MATIKRVAELANAGQMEESLALKLEKAGPIADRLERLTNEMANRAEAGMMDKNQAGQEAYRRSRVLIVSLAAIGMVIAILLGHAISGSIIMPVRRMDEQLANTAPWGFRETDSHFQPRRNRQSGRQPEPHE